MNLKKTYILPCLSLLTILGFWEFMVRFLHIPNYVLPTPNKIVLALWTEKNNMLIHSLVTLKETFYGVVIALILAIIMAIAMDRFNNFKLAFYPILLASQTIPIVVLAPILIIYMGFGILPKVFIVVLMCFFPIVINFTDGLARVDQKMVNLIRLMGGKNWHIYSLVKIPSALPELFSGLKVSATYSIMGAVVGEWLASSQGLGYYLLRVKNAYLMDKVFACVVMIIILSLMMNFIVSLMESIFIRRRI